MVWISFLTVLILLISASEILLPRWPLEFLAGVRPYLRYTQATTSIRELFGPVGGTIVLLFLVAAIAVAGWRAKSERIDSDVFRLAISLVLAFTCIVIPSLAPHNQVLLVPAFLLLVKDQKRLRAAGRIARSLWSATWLTLIWPWAAGGLLAITFLFNRASPRLWDAPLATNPLIPITLFVALMPLLMGQARYQQNDETARRHETNRAQ
jgi:hypothetical protein